MDLFLKFPINAARRLPNVPSEHICSQLHGHTFLVELWLRGEVEQRSGWVVDFADIDAPVEMLKQDLEHRYLNDVAGLENPTSENLAIWIWERIAVQIPNLSKIVVMEGTDRGCSYSGPAAI